MMNPDHLELFKSKLAAIRESLNMASFLVTPEEEPMGRAIRAEFDHAVKHLTSGDLGRFEFHWHRFYALANQLRHARQPRLEPVVPQGPGIVFLANDGRDFFSHAAT